MDEKMPHEAEPVGAWVVVRDQWMIGTRGGASGRFMVSVKNQSPTFFVYACCPVATPLFVKLAKTCERIPIDYTYKRPQKVQFPCWQATGLLLVGNADRRNEGVHHSVAL